MLNNTKNSLRFRLQRAILLLAILPVIFLASPLMASDVTGAYWSGIVRITNNDAVASVVSVNFTLSTSDMIDSGYLNATATDVVIQNQAASDVPFMPGFGSNPWVVFVSSIGTDQLLDYALYTDNASGGDIRYFPGPSGMTTPDDASIRLSDNYTFEVQGYFDATVSGNITGKQGSLTFAGDGSGNVSVEFGVSGNTTPDGFIDGGGTWNNEAKAYDGSIATGANENTHADGTWGNFVEYTHAEAVVDEVGYYLCNNVLITQVDIDAYYLGAYNDVYEGAFTQQVWETKPLPSAQNVTKTRWRFYNGGGAGAAAGVVWEIGLSSSITSLSTSGVSSGEHTFALTDNTTHKHLYIDGDLKDSATTGIVSSDSDYISFTNNVMPYVQYQEITIDGVQQQLINWEYSDNFTDLSGNGHWATPTFRTSSSDANVSASLLSFAPISQAQATQYSVGDYGTMVTAPSNIPQMYTELSPTLPGTDVINDLADAGSVPRALIWFPLTFLVVVIAGFLSYRFTGSLFFQAIVMGVGLAFFAVTGVFGFWSVIIYGIEATAIMMATKQFGW